MSTHNDAGRPYVMPSAPSRDIRYVPTTKDVHPWMDEASCLGYHYWIDADPTMAKKVCGACPVLAACEKRSLNMQPLPEFGVWAGMTAKELRNRARTLTVVSVAAKPRGVPGPGCGNHRAVKDHRRNGELPCVECRAFLTSGERKYRANANRAS